MGWLIPVFKSIVPDPVKQKALSSWLNRWSLREHSAVFGAAVRKVLFAVLAQPRIFCAFSQHGTWDL